MAIQYSMSSQLHGTNGYGVNFSDTVFSIHILDEVPTYDIVIPDEFPIGTFSTGSASWIAEITTTAPIFVALNKDLVTPLDDTFTMHQTILVTQYEKVARYVVGGQVLLFKAPEAGAYITVQLYSVNR